MPKEGLEPQLERQGAPKVPRKRESDSPSLPAPEDSNPTDPGSRSDSGVTPDAVDTALATAIADATKAGKWDVIVLLARELEARRVARVATNVVDLAAERAKR